MKFSKMNYKALILFNQDKIDKNLAIFLLNFALIGVVDDIFECGWYSKDFSVNYL